MKQMIGTVGLFLLMGAALAEETVYHVFADGLGCAQCAVEINGKLRAIDGVERVEVLAERGVVNVRVADGHALVEKQVASVLAEAGAIFRRMETHPVGAGENAAESPVQRSESMERLL